MLWADLSEGFDEEGNSRLRLENNAAQNQKGTKENALIILRAFYLYGIMYMPVK